MGAIRIAKKRRHLAWLAALFVALAGCSGEDATPRSEKSEKGGSGTRIDMDGASSEDVDAQVGLARTRALAVLTVELYEAGFEAPASLHASTALQETPADPQIEKALRDLVKLIDRSAKGRAVAAAGGRVQRLTDGAYDEAAEGARPRHGARVFAALLNDAVATYGDALDADGRRIEDDAAYREAYALQAEARRRLFAIGEALTRSELVAVNEAMGVVTIAMPAPHPPRRAQATADEVRKAADAANAAIERVAG